MDTDPNTPQNTFQMKTFSSFEDAETFTQGLLDDLNSLAGERQENEVEEGDDDEEEDSPPFSTEALEIASESVVKLEIRLKDARSCLAEQQEAFAKAQRQYDREANNRARYKTEIEYQRILLEDHLPHLEAAESMTLTITSNLLSQLGLIGEATKHDREPSLSDEEMSRANTRRPFVKEDCEELPLRTLYHKMLHALQAGDPSLQYLYQRYGRQRLERKQESDSHSPQEREKLARLLTELTDRLVDKRPRKVNAEVKELRKEIIEFRSQVEARRRELSIQNNPRYAIGNNPANGGSVGRYSV